MSLWLERKSRRAEIAIYVLPRVLEILWSAAKHRRLVVPVPFAPLPIGVQIIAAPWREDIALRIACALEKSGVVTARRPAT